MDVVRSALAGRSLLRLSALAPSGDPEVRKLVREVLQERGTGPFCKGKEPSPWRYMSYVHTIGTYLLLGPLAIPFHRSFGCEALGLNG